MDIFGSHDYREILRRELSRRMKQNPRYSQGAFARDLDLTPSRLSEILHGKQGVSGRVAQEMAKNLRFNPEESTYFLDLVESQHGRSRLLREAARERLQARHQTLYAEHYGEPGFETVSDWHHLAILEVLRLARCEPKAEWISHTLNLDISDVEEALKRLQELHLVSVSESGIVEALPNHKRFAGSSESVTVQKFSRQILWKSLDAVGEIRPHAMHSFMLAIPESKLPQLLATIKESSLRLAEELDADKDEKDAVYCLSLQFFPVSRARGVTLGAPDLH